MRVLLIQTGFIGDVVLSTPVFTFAKEIFPQAKIDLLTTKSAASFFESDSRFNQIIIFDKKGVDRGLAGFFKILKKIRIEKYDKIFSLHKSIRTALLVFLADAKETYGFNEASLSFLYKERSSRKEYQHDVLRNLAIFKALNFDPLEIARPLSLSFSKHVTSKIDNFLSNYSNSIIGIAPGSVWATKRWTVEGFSKVANYLTEKNYQVFVIGGPEDFKLAEQIISKNKKCENICGKFSLAESAYLISKLKIVITNDSSPLHMASAGQTPVVSIFCATVPEFGYGPWMVKNRILGVEGLACRPCGRHGGNSCPTGTHHCQIRLEASMVEKAIESLEQEI